MPPDTQSKMIGTYSGTPIDIVDVLPCCHQLSKRHGYVLRHRIDDAVAVTRYNTVCRSQPVLYNAGQSNPCKSHP